MDTGDRCGHWGQIQTLGTDVDTGDRCGHWGQMQTLGTDVDTGDRCRHWGQIQTLGTDVDTGDRCRHWGQMWTLGTDTDTGDRCGHWGQMWTLGTGTDIGDSISRENHKQISNVQNNLIPTHIRTLPSPAIIPTFSVLWSEQVEEKQLDNEQGTWNLIVPVVMGNTFNCNAC